MSKKNRKPNVLQRLGANIEVAPDYLKPLFRAALEEAQDIYATAGRDAARQGKRVPPVYSYPEWVLLAAEPFPEPEEPIADFVMLEYPDGSRDYVPGAYEANVPEALPNYGGVPVRVMAAEVFHEGYAIEGRDGIEVFDWESDAIMAIAEAKRIERMHDAGAAVVEAERKMREEAEA